MANVEKKKKKLVERIEQLEDELKNSLHKKTVGPAINVASYRDKINDLKLELSKM